MNDVTTTNETDAGRVQRSAAGLVAGYIHELSERHEQVDTDETHDSEGT